MTARTGHTPPMPTVADIRSRLLKHRFAERFRIQKLRDCERCSVKPEWA